jgi:hypothetical protein
MITHHEEQECFVAAGFQTRPFPTSEPFVSFVVTDFVRQRQVTREAT